MVIKCLLASCCIENKIVKKILYKIVLQNCVVDVWYELFKRVYRTYNFTHTHICGNTPL